MAVEILMPAISPSMVSGKLVRWHVEPGAKIRKGDVLAELQVGSLEELSRTLERIRLIKGISNSETSIHLESFRVA